MENSKPQCLGFIMDGNRRWAKEKGLLTIEGHTKGADVLEETIRFIHDEGIPHAIFYSFSSENWNRSEEEVSNLLDLFAVRLDDIINDEGDSKKGVKARLRFVGDLEKFPPSIQEKISSIEENSAQHKNTTIWLALSYGGRGEIVSAVNRAVEKGEQVTEETFGRLLWTDEMPDPDLIIRTGGQQRLSNFLPWQSVYSEFLFIDDYWPDLNFDTLKKILENFVERKRNFGK